MRTLQSTHRTLLRPYITHTRDRLGFSLSSGSFSTSSGVYLPRAVVVRRNALGASDAASPSTFKNSKSSISPNSLRVQAQKTAAAAEQAKRLELEKKAKILEQQRRQQQEKTSKGSKRSV
ncbi:hypothetical protein K435DRAFT_503161 [Dendrothele bispora CBS 962.96]|uniref:Uncharacterized protein n=1 Tax=Dendrothele bispora (strain CBS 962.96) TaxID=1314807 RepID=A0A4S8KWR7_DENBC|nr:hypothetical protein K435DRAFT_503161 [Dendrothele bispora CBS 962.96]